MKFHNIRKSDACSVRNSKFNLDAVVSVLCFEHVMNERTHNNTQKYYFLKNYFEKPMN